MRHCPLYTKEPAALRGTLLKPKHCSIFSTWTTTKIPILLVYLQSPNLVSLQGILNPSIKHIPRSICRATTTATSPIPRASQRETTWTSQRCSWPAVTTRLASPQLQLQLRQLVQRSTLVLVRCRLRLRNSIQRIRTQHLTPVLPYIYHCHASSQYTRTHLQSHILPRCNPHRSNTSPSKSHHHSSTTCHRWWTSAIP